MTNNSLQEKTLKGAFWAFLEKIGLQAVSFVVTMVLARYLSPSDYGTVALLSIFFAIAGVLIDGGFGSALVQKKDVTELDFNSVFYLSLFVSVLMYAVMYVCAPMISRFYDEPMLVPIIRVSAITLILGAVNSIQNAELTRRMLFNLSFRIALITSIVSAVVGITLAVLKFGPWALVWSSVVSSAVGVGTRWWLIAWRPRLMFSFAAIKPLFSFGWKMTVIYLLDGTVNNLYGLIIGKLYSRADLAYFNKGRSVPDLAMGTIEGTIGRVTFPALMRLQDDKLKLRNAMRKMIMLSTFFVFPLMTGLAVCAPNLVYILYGPQWDQSIPYMQIFCFSVALMPLHNTNLTAITAIGRSGLFLILELIKKTLLLATLFLVFKFGVMAFAIALAFVTSPLCVVINTWPNKKLFGYSLRMQIQDILPSLLLSTVMGGAVYLVGRCFNCDTMFARSAMLVLQFVVGGVLYFYLVILFRLEAGRQALEILAKKAPKRLESIILRISCCFRCQNDKANSW